ncbi:hypothetical protein [Sphingobium fontiphilum]|uniref:hypothetical protein n=1 Tax=Sphingobium fontiphilum TaxID=944425 RepID=UPI00160FFF61|nr:hypothetical protein [Sphingobium fontiphilum]
MAVAPNPFSSRTPPLFATMGHALPRPFFWMMVDANMNNPVDMNGKVAIITGHALAVDAGYRSR